MQSTFVDREDSGINAAEISQILCIFNKQVKKRDQQNKTRSLIRAVFPQSPCALELSSVLTVLRLLLHNVWGHGKRLSNADGQILLYVISNYVPALLHFTNRESYFIILVNNILE